MRKLMAPFVVLWVTAVPAQDRAPPAGGNERILEELRQLREQVAALEKRVAELDERFRKTEEPRRGAGSPEGRGADREALARIKLPEDPTREQVLEYVHAIARASRGQNRYISSRG